MNHLVGGVSDILQRLVGEDIDVQVALLDEPWPVKVDRSQFEQVIMNLVVNARDAMPDGGRLTIETGNAEIGEQYAATHPLVPPGDYALLAVTDTGIGMSSEVQARLFEPFFTTKEPGKGTGLGLSMVYGIVKQGGGFIWVYSELGKGTCFKIYLPKVELSESTKTGEHTSQTQPIKKGGTILLVEDEESLRDVISDFLRSGGHKVLVADCLDEACRVALEQRLEIDLLLTDVILKGGNAKQLVDRLNEQGCAFRVVYISGYTPNAIVHHGVLDPGTLFLQKPFSRSALLDKVEEALSSGS
jgi:CheY-like chemotaxis protein